MFRNIGPLFYLLISIEPSFPCEQSAKMLLQELTTVFGCLLTIQCRDIGKPFRSIPSITGSLVNLGKMDISFHFNGKDSSSKMEHLTSPQHSFMFSKSEPLIEEPCPCPALRNVKDNFINHPSEILSKILTSGDLFSFNKEPPASTLCCSSHEHAQEDIVTFEFGPKDAMSMNPNSNLPKLPFIFENILSRRPPMSSLSQIPGKAKAVEIFLFPKKKETQTNTPMKKDNIRKDNIQVVGDKDYKNDFKTMKHIPSLPINFQSSVKKDLTAQEMNETNKLIEKEDVEVTTAGNPNSLK